MEKSNRENNKEKQDNAQTSNNHSPTHMPSLPKHQPKNSLFERYNDMTNPNSLKGNGRHQPTNLRNDPPTSNTRLSFIFIFKLNFNIYFLNKYQ